MTGARGDLRAAAEAGEVVADVAVVLLDREGQVLAGEQLLLRDQPVEALPVVGQGDAAPDADLLEKSPAGRVITPAQLPGQGSPCHRVVGSPDPNLVFLPFTKCHISSIWTMPLDGVAEGAGASSPASRTHLSTATWLTPSSLAIIPWLTLPRAVEQHRQRLHRGRLAAGRRGREAAAARLAAVALAAVRHAVPDERSAPAVLAAQPAHADPPRPGSPARK